MHPMLCRWAAVALASCSALACVRDPKNDQPAPVQLADASASVARFAATAPRQGASAEPPRHHTRARARGPTGALLSQLRTVELSPQQATAVSAIEAELAAASDPWRIQGELGQAVAADVRAGKIDRKKLEPQLKVVRDAAAEEKARQAKALNTLHSTLEDVQRKALVLAVRGRQERRASHAAFGAKGEETLKGLSERRAKRELERLSTDLELTAEQRGKTEKLLAANPNFGASSRAMLEAPAALLDAFDKPTFDATKLKLDQDGEQALNQRLDYLSKLTQILTPEQRNKLADSLVHRGGFENNRKAPGELETEDPARPDGSPG